ncbi:hypothetical protein [Gracilimonas sp.]|uniref:hypothetical protein n=1 Tax=Gracilimonas sp. TaxID=1974203 RepID=UPI0032ECC27D
MAQQPSLGILWDNPVDTSEAKAKLDIYAAHGIDYIQLNHPVNTETLSLLRDTPFTILVQLDKPFLTISEIQQKQTNLLQQFGETADYYRSYLNVAAIGLLKNSQTFHPDFADSFSPILDSLSIRSNKEFYFYANENWYYLNAPTKPFATLYSDSAFHFSDIVSFNTIFSKEVNQNSGLVFFVNSKWLDEALVSYPEFSESLLLYSENNQWQVPLPESDESGESQSWMILLLVLLWVTLAILFKTLPYLRPMLLRYFLAHRFFVDDILHYRERAITGGISLMAMHAVFSGIVFYILANSSISDAGLDAFYHHMPSLAIVGANYASFFVFGVLLTLVVQSIALLWLYLPAKNLEHFSQAVNLYAGTFFLDFLTATILVTLFVTGFGLTYILTFGALFVLIWFGAFNISAFDISRGMGQGTAIYLLLTIGLHTILSVGLLILFFVNQPLVQILELAINL